MVKGNKERRQELARRRNDEKAAEVERRKLGPAFATPAEARARLLSDARGGAAEAELVGWIVSPGGREGCESWFRTGACPHRRCRFSHDASISHLAGVPPPGSAVAPTSGGSRGRSASPAARRARRASSADAHAAAGGEAAAGGAPPPPPAAVPLPEVFPVLEPCPLREVEAGAKMVYDRHIRTTVRTESPLLFIQKGRFLVFDAYNPTVFAAHCAETAAAAAAAAAAVAAAGGGGGGGGGEESQLDAALRVRFSSALAVEAPPGGGAE
jgi:hypothetical protein